MGSLLGRQRPQLEQNTMKIKSGADLQFSIGDV
jgi:hypothetical protein